MRKWRNCYLTLGTRASRTRQFPTAGLHAPAKSTSRTPLNSLSNALRRRRRGANGLSRASATFQADHIWCTRIDEFDDVPTLVVIRQAEYEIALIELGD